MAQSDALTRAVRAIGDGVGEGGSAGGSRGACLCKQGTQPGQWGCVSDMRRLRDSGCGMGEVAQVRWARAAAGGAVLAQRTPPALALSCILLCNGGESALSALCAPANGSAMRGTETAIYGLGSRTGGRFLPASSTSPHKVSLQCLGLAAGMRGADVGYGCSGAPGRCRASAPITEPSTHPRCLGMAGSDTDRPTATARWALERDYGWDGLCIEVPPPPPTLSLLFSSRGQHLSLAPQPSQCVVLFFTVRLGACGTQPNPPHWWGLAHRRCALAGALVPALFLSHAASELRERARALPGRSRDGGRPALRPAGRRGHSAAPPPALRVCTCNVRS
eukprot:3331803-Rhodomonas_salina.1